MGSKELREKTAAAAVSDYVVHTGVTARWVSCALVLAACSSPPNDTSDASAEAGPFVVAAHDTPPPTALNGGGVLASASIVLATFQNYTMADQVEGYADWIVASPWLAAVGGEYGVGTLASPTKVRLAETAPTITSTSGFTSYVASKVGTALPAPSPSTLYVFVLPDGATVSDPMIGVLCNQFTGYHDAAPQRAYAFALVGTCPKHVAGLTDFEQVERVLSHELIEALTDPFGDGYAARDPSDPWSWVAGGEVADVCNGYAHEQGFLAVRSWSNVAAAASEDPCQPNDSPAAYFTLTAPVTSAAVAVGGSTSIAVTGWSNEPVSDWVVDVFATGQFAPSAKIAPTTMNNGTSAALTITVPPGATPGTHGVVMLESLHPADATYNLFPIVVLAK